MKSPKQELLLEETLEIVQRKSFQESPLEVETNLIEAGVLDSLTLVDLIVELETHFDIRIPPNEISPANLRTPLAIATLVDRLDGTPLGEPRELSATAGSGV